MAYGILARTGCSFPPAFPSRKLPPGLGPGVKPSVSIPCSQLQQGRSWIVGTGRRPPSSLGRCRCQAPPLGQLQDAAQEQPWGRSTDVSRLGLHCHACAPICGHVHGRTLSHLHVQTCAPGCLCLCSRQSACVCMFWAMFLHVQACVLATFLCAHLCSGLYPFTCKQAHVHSGYFSVFMDMFWAVSLQG